MITEMDVDILPAAWDYEGADISRRADLRRELKPYPDGLPEEKQEEPARRYGELFARDSAISSYYNNVLAGGKWSHMLDQTHIGYTGWQQPDARASLRSARLSPPRLTDLISVGEFTNFKLDHKLGAGQCTPTGSAPTVTARTPQTPSTFF